MMHCNNTLLHIKTCTRFLCTAEKNSDLTTARKFNYCPILRKDFIIEEYQIVEAKSIGADVVLLLANVLKALQESGIQAL